MMMGQIISYLIAALTCIVFVTACPAIGAEAENQNLTETISQWHDTHMTVEDLAFFLVTHNYDATPKDGYVQVKIDCAIYKVVPNGANTGLADPPTIN